MTSTELLDMSFRVYQNLGRQILSGTVIPTLFALAAVGFIVYYVVPAFFTTTDATDVRTQVIESASAMVLALVVAGPLLLIGVTYTSIFVTHLVSDYLLGDVSEVTAAQRNARAKLRSIFWLNVRQLLIACSGLIVAVLLLMLSALVNALYAKLAVGSGVIVALAVLSLIAGFFVLFVVVMREALAGPAAVLEGVQGRRAARRSVQLMTGAANQPSGYGTLWLTGLLLLFLILLIWIGVYGSLVLTGIHQHLGNLAAVVPFGALLEVAVDLLPWFLTLLLVVPVWSTVTTLLYYERRVRLEAYDVEALAQDVWRSYRAGRFEL